MLPTERKLLFLWPFDFSNLSLDKNFNIGTIPQNLRIMFSAKDFKIHAFCDLCKWQLLYG